MKIYPYIMNRFTSRFGIILPNLVKDTSWLNLLNRNIRHSPSFIGQGFINNEPDYFLTHAIVKNPKWHSAYAAYQAEISQGRLTMFNHYQDLAKWLTNKEYTNASSLDDCQAAVDGVNMFKTKHRIKDVLLDLDGLYPYRRKSMEYYAEGMGWKIAATGEGNIKISQSVNPDTGNLRTAPCDILFYDPKCGLLQNYDRCDAPIKVGHLQNFGLPLSAGGPYLGFITADREYGRNIPGKMVVPAVNQDGQEVYRLGLQTREQHIRRDRAMSNICTNQSLMAVYAAAWTALHGIDKISDNFARVNQVCQDLIIDLDMVGYDVKTTPGECLDTVVFTPCPDINARLKNYEHTVLDNGDVSVTLDWTHTDDDMEHALDMFATTECQHIHRTDKDMPPAFFRSGHSELNMARYLQKQTEKDITLVDSMIPLGSCTMKYNPMHIFRVFDQDNLLSVHPLSKEMIHVGKTLDDFKTLLCKLTGFDGSTLSPLSGSHGELVSLMAIKKYHTNSVSDSNPSPRNTVLLPKSCHGTNAASCAMAGFDIEIMDDTNLGSNSNFNFADTVRTSIEKCGAENVAAIMITFPNTLGYFDDDVPEALSLVREAGGLCYMDGANLNSMVGHLNLQKVGFDIAHLNLHKTFAVPHGGGGPGAGPLLFRNNLAKCLPDWDKQGQHGISPYGNTLANFMSMLYLSEMTTDEIKDIAVGAVYNANYLKDLLKEHFDIITDKEGQVSHELVIKMGDINATSFCKRLIDYDYHPPTVNWPLANCLMIEPTETEDLETIKRFAEVMIKIKDEHSQNPSTLCSAPTNSKYTSKIDEVASDRKANEVLKRK